MKKLCLLFAAASFAFGASAQTASHITLSEHEQMAKTPPSLNAPKVGVVNSSKELSSAMRTSKLPTAKGGNRWYSHFLTTDQLVGQGWTATPTASNLSYSPMWFDSTVTQRYSNGVFPVNLSSCAEYVDPRYFQYNNPKNPLLGKDTALIEITSTGYTVDSVQIMGAYVPAPGKSSIVDTLIISVQPEQYINYYPVSLAPWINQNPNVTDTAMYGFFPSTDSVWRCAEMDNAASPIPGGVKWKEPLYGNKDTSQFIGYYSFKVGGATGTAAHIPAGMNYAISFTFKSGDTWIPNVDSIQEFNTFYTTWGYQSSPPSWMTYWYGNRQGTTPGTDTSWHDENGSSVMDSRNYGGQAFYFATIADQAFQNSFSPSNGNFAEQYLWVTSHVICDSCYSIAQVDSIKRGDTTTTAVGNLSSTISTVTAYPSPANDVVYIPFTLNSNAQVSVALTNTVGQVVRTQNMGRISAGKAVFYTSDLPSGTYIYSIKADGQTTTGKISIAH